MNILAQLFSGQLGDLIKGIISEFHMDPEKKAQYEAQLAQIQQQAIIGDQQLEAKLSETAGENIRAEESSGDKYTVRARPTVLYVVLAILVFNLVIVKILSYAYNRTFVQIDLPDPLLWLFGSIILGYTGARSWDKFIQAPGESTLQVPGIKIGNTSPPQK